MLCDPEDLTITFANKQSMATLKMPRHLLPVKAEAIVGSCIDIFHENPARQRSVLARTSNFPHQAQIKLGEEILDLNVDAVYGDDGDYLGLVLTWSVVTEFQHMTDGFESNVKAGVDQVAEAGRNGRRSGRHKSGP